MIPYARLKPGPGFRPARAAAYYLQRFATHPTARRAACQALAVYLRARHPQDRQRLEEHGLCTLKALADDGIAELKPLLDTAAVQAMRAYLETQRVAGPNGAVFPDELPSDVTAVAYPLETVLACPGVVALMNRADLLGLAGAYLGCKPTISSVGIRWTFSGLGPEARFQNFHRDLDDWRFVKVFVYLTDVNDGGGPHVYVRGSHLSGFGLTARSYDEARLSTRYGPAAITPVLGPSGTSFIADTIGVHRAEVPRTASRLVLQIQYSLLPVYAFQYAPRLRSEADYDLYCSRLLLKPS